MPAASQMLICSAELWLPCGQCGHRVLLASQEVGSPALGALGHRGRLCPNPHPRPRRAPLHTLELTASSYNARGRDGGGVHPEVGIAG